LAFPNNGLGRGGHRPALRRHLVASRDTARILLGWSAEELAQRADIGLATLKRLEAGEGVIKGRYETVDKLLEAVEAAGIVFSEGGVTLKE
jgi:transcriptional regulator with XRE-family HTH domain